MSEATPRGAGTTGIDTSDMKALHRVFREALSLAPQLVGGVTAGDKARSALVGSYYFNVLRLLHVHHDGEDELLWPKLYERCPERAELVKRAAGQHQDVVALVEESCKQTSQWSASAEPADAEQLQGTIDSLQTVLVAHLDEEEELVLPLCSQHLSQAEWGQLPQHGMKSFDGDKPWLIMGLIRDQLAPDQLSGMDAALPPPVKQMWATFGQSAYNEFMNELSPPSAP